ncbi:MAG TPA: antibiotic biosynthesis monooxygenase [Gaiellaceae bacterium]|nr:antibiotic biosynthesis monooxygenase [Gaiellaceae bacterium]
MVIRVFRAQPKQGMADEFAQLVQTVSVPFVDGQPGLVARFTGRGIGRNSDEIVMISIWESVEALKNMTGEHWEEEVIPDPREAERIESCSVDHYQSIG